MAYETDSGRACSRLPAYSLTPVPRRARPGVHPAANVDPQAKLYRDVEIAAGAFVGPDVELLRGVRVGPNAVITGRVVVAEDVRIFSGAVVGEEPQDLKFDGESSSLRIGPRTCIREHATVHRGCGEGSETVVGADVLLMANSHVGHNCRIGDRAVVCNGALLAGHVEVSPEAFISGNVVVHQFVRIGRRAMIGGASRVSRDVPPFALLVGDSEIRGVNGVGLRRAGIERAAQEEIRLAYRRLFRCSGAPREVLSELAKTLKTAPARELLAFLAAPSQRGACAMRPRSRTRA